MNVNGYQAAGQEEMSVVGKLYNRFEEKKSNNSLNRIVKNRIVASENTNKEENALIALYRAQLDEKDAEIESLKLKNAYNSLEISELKRNTNYTARLDEKDAEIRSLKREYGDKARENGNLIIKSARLKRTIERNDKNEQDLIGHVYHLSNDLEKVSDELEDAEQCIYMQGEIIKQLAEKLEIANNVSGLLVLNTLAVQQKVVNQIHNNNFRNLLEASKQSKS